MLRQGVYKTSALQKYPIGYRFLEPGPPGYSERVFHYGKSQGLSVLAPTVGVASGITFPEHAFIGANALAGAFVLTCTAVGDVVADQFAGGWCVTVGLPANTTRSCYRIKSNTAASAGNDFTVTLYDPIVGALATATDYVVLHANPYGSMRSPRQETLDGGILDVNEIYHFSYLGVPLVAVPLNHYFWMQTWGPCAVMGSFNVGDLAGAMEVGLDFHQDGTLDLMALGTGHQLAGFHIPHSWWGAAAHAEDYGANVFTMLQITP